MSLDDWPVLQRSAITILTADPDEHRLKLEPSGLSSWTDADGKRWIYLASDNGRVARIAAGDTSNDWQTHRYGRGDEFDFESIANAGDGYLLVGVEGTGESGAYTYPHIKQLDPSDDTDSEVGTLTDKVWKLKHFHPDPGDGMEAMAFIPKDQCPSAWGTPTSFDGFVLVGYQSLLGQALVYDLPENDGTSVVEARYVATVTIDNPDPDGYPDGMKFSDFHFDAATGRLFVLYDDTTDVLQQVTLSAARGTTVFAAGAPKVGCEAVTVIGSDVYIGLDQNAEQMEENGASVNHVFDYPGFL